jgi:hypothetical protein
VALGPFEQAFTIEHCPIARSLAVVGDRWTLLILRDLVRLGPRRFHDLERSLSRISPNTLSLRLKRCRGVPLQRHLIAVSQRRSAVVMGACDKGLHAAYAVNHTPPEKLHQPWIDDCLAQMTSALRAVDAMIEPVERYLLLGRLTQAAMLISCRASSPTNS